jgi:hypothetical protein
LFLRKAIVLYEAAHRAALQNQRLDLFDSDPGSRFRLTELQEDPADHIAASLGFTQCLSHTVTPHISTNDNKISIVMVIANMSTFLDM